jgi:hypothetical protein
MRILMWHVHGSWTTAFVQGHHRYLLPVTPGRDSNGLGRARTWEWPQSAVEVPFEELRNLDFDLILLQRPKELQLAELWTGRRPGRDVPAIYVEHNTPGEGVPYSRHALADQTTIPIVHVTHFNQLFWDSGAAPTDVVEHGVVDPGHLYTGELARAAVVVNDPVRRGRAVGTDLLPTLSRATGLDVFGIKVSPLRDSLRIDPQRLCTYDDLPQSALHCELARRRLYLHLSRWTSLGLSLLEAMHLGMPIVALATTEAVSAVPTEAGVISTSVDELASATRRFVNDPDEAHAVGACARRVALSRYGLGRFLGDWDIRLEALAAGDAHPASPTTSRSATRAGL